MNWYQEAALRTPDGLFANDFGDQVALADDLLFVSAPPDSDAGNGDGAVYVFERDNGLWTWTQKVLPSSCARGFGQQIATDGTTLLASTVVDLNCPNTTPMVAVIQRGANGWEETSALIPFFGGQVVIPSRLAVDGDRLLVGSSGVSVSGTIAGAVFVYEGSGASWSLLATLTSSDSVVHEMGRDVALSADGQTALLGSPGNNIGKETVQIFDEASLWANPVELQSSDGTMPGRFGNSLGLSGDLLGVGAFQSVVSDAGSGGAYVFSLSCALSPTLTVNPDSISLAAGGTQRLFIKAGPENAGKLFVLAGSPSGVDPGLASSGLRVPINLDSYLLLTLSSGAGSALVMNSGFLPTSGSTTVDLVIPPGTDPSLAGLDSSHAFVVFGGGGAGLAHVSYVTSLTLDN